MSEEQNAKPAEQDEQLSEDQQALIDSGAGGDYDGEVTQPHPEQPGYGVTGKFPTQDADLNSDAGDELVSSEPASVTDALEAPADDGMEAQPASQADQLDAPEDQRGDTA